MKTAEQWKAAGHGYCTAKCVYCGTVTGGYPLGHGEADRTTPTVCGKHQYSSECDEAREIAAGIVPWQRPLSFWVGFFNMKPVGGLGRYPNP